MKKTEFVSIKTLADMLSISERELLEHTERGRGGPHDLAAWVVRSAAGVVRGYDVPIDELKDLARDVDVQLPPSLWRGGGKR